MLHTVIFIGRSGCGKGTQADLFKNRIHRQDEEKRHILYVESGQHFREFVRGKSYTAKLSKAIYDSDERQPNFLGSWVWSNILIDQLEENMHLVLDGSPRARPEAELLTTALNFYQRERPVVIYIDVSRRWSEEKLLARGRSDDASLAKIDKRLDWFDRDVMPAVDYLKNNPFYRFIEVSGEQSIEKVHSDIIAAYDYQA
jgi:adenylate kinase family enzyme